MSVFFDGQLLVTPTTASVVNDDAMRNQNIGIGNVAAFVGRSTGGAPKTPLRFSSPDAAKRVLRSGELLDAVLKAFDPSAELGAPSTVVAMRVNPAVQADLPISDAGDVVALELKSIGYGLGENHIRVKIETGTLQGKRLTVQQGDRYFTADNVGASAFSVQYTGTEETATVSVTSAEVTLSAPAGTVAAKISLTDFPTVGSLVDRINATPGFRASVTGRSDSVPTLNALDHAAAQSVLDAFTVRADLQAVVDWFNGNNQDLVRATRQPGAGAPPANLPTTYLAGGSDGVTTFDDWAASYEALQRVDVQWVTPISGDPAIHAMNDTHVSFCSNQLRKERRSVVGTGLNTSNEDAIAAAKLLNSDRTSLVHIGHYDYDATGKLVLYPAYMTAALIAGAFSGVNPGTPLTNKTLKVRGWERDLVNPTETDELILGGVLAVENTDAGYKVVKSISTWRQNDNYNRVEQSCGFALDFTVRAVRQAVDVLRGQKGNQLIPSRAVSITDSVLRELARAEPEGPGVLAGDANSQAFRGIRASITGDVTRVEFECSPVIPNNYNLVTVYAVPYSGSASA
ncbi:hypothetical protein K32_49320 [Kaistia sp. 32K]|uniref:hypothetical protein n=1 Tax=Kaistia sp. 32K TaxID=2795690 RepID=UPI001915CD21|nr:hypothetical protein [Kaistia sp. 32K]BCP56315.1 hypothetical protein K32_49320 [Kaistia sp. 32K]